MAMPSRKFAAGGGYRYGFNGQERSTEINENNFTAEFWQYDARLGRRWNVDPIVKVYESSYATFANNPIWFSDPTGADTTINGKTYKDLSPFVIEAKIPKEGAKRQNLTHDIFGPKMETQYYHRSSPCYGSKAGWYNGEGYVNVLGGNGFSTGSPAAAVGHLYQDFGLVVGYNHSPAVGSQDSYRNELSEYIAGLDEPEDAFYGALLAAARKSVSKSNFAVTGTIYYSTINVEDFIGIGLLLKGVVKTALSKELVIITADGAAKGVSVIGPRATYRQFAKDIGAKFLNVTDDAWTWAKNEKFLAGVVKRGDDVVFAGKFNPAKLDPNSVLAREIKYLTERGYQWTDDFSKMIKK